MVAGSGTNQRAANEVVLIKKHRCEGPVPTIITKYPCKSRKIWLDGETPAGSEGKG
jgi:hypothetical protein